MTNKTPQAYRVTGAHAVLGHEPGETFIPTCGEEQLRRLVDRGSLEAVATPKEQEK